MTQDYSASAAANDDVGGFRLFLEHNPQLARALGAALILLATLLAYVPAIRGGFIWDDDYYVVNNGLLRNWEGLQRIWFDVLPSPAHYPLPQYYPMTHTSFWIEYRLWGLNPTGYHITNVILHGLSALLIWLILAKLDLPGAWVAAAFFSLHPLNVESVAWIAERKNVLSLFFFLSALYVYLRYAGIISAGKLPVDETAADGPSKPALFSLPEEPGRLYALAIVLFLCALFSKTVTSSLPAVVLLLIWWKRGRITMKDVVPLLPFFALGLAAGALTAYMEKVRVGVGARAEEWQYAPTAAGQFLARCLIAGHALWFYVGKLLWPYPLIFNYPRWQIDPGNPVQYLYPAAAIAVLIVLAALMRRIGRGPLVAALYYLITLFPALGFINVWPMQYSFVADHFSYFSTIGLIALGSALVARHVSLEALSGIAAVVLLICFGTTWAQGGVYRNNETLWRTTLERTDQRSWFAANNYGYALLQDGKLDNAESWFRKTLRLKPNHLEARWNLADIAERRGDTKAAIEYLQDALKLYPRDAEAHDRYALLLAKLGREPEAADEARQAIELFAPRIHPVANLLLGRILLKQGKTEEAIACFDRVLEAEPDSVLGYSSRGLALLQAGQVEAGLNDLNEALRLAPDDASLPVQFAQWMEKSGEYPMAVQYLDRALAIDPRSPEALTESGIVAAKSGHPDLAAEFFKRALAADPGYAPAKENQEALASGKLKATTQAASKPASQPATKASTGP